MRESKVLDPKAFVAPKLPIVIGDSGILAFISSVSKYFSNNVVIFVIRIDPPTNELANLRGRRSQNSDFVLEVCARQGQRRGREIPGK